MKPKAFDYVRVDTLPALFAALQTHDNAKIIAGGQSLVPMMNFRVAQPEVLVDINGIEALRHIQRDGMQLRIGAMVRYQDLIDSPQVRACLPLLVEALGHVGYPAIRNRGTLGGSVVHNDPSAEGGVALRCLGAELVVASATGERVVPIAEFLVTTYLTDIAPHEVLTEIRIPVPGPRTGSAFREVAKRVGDFAIVNVAALVSVDARGSERSVARAREAWRRRRWRSTSAEPSSVDRSMQSVRRRRRGSLTKRSIPRTTTWPARHTSGTWRACS